MIDWKFEDFQEKFLNLDPFRTGFVTKEEFIEILKNVEHRFESIDLEEISVAFANGFILFSVNRSFRGIN